MPKTHSNYRDASKPVLHVHRSGRASPAQTRWKPRATPAPAPALPPPAPRLRGRRGPRAAPPARVRVEREAQRRSLAERGWGGWGGHCFLLVCLVGVAPFVLPTGTRVHFLQEVGSAQTKIGETPVLVLI